MASAEFGAVLSQVRRLFHGGGTGGMTEGQLLERFAIRGDEGAFEALLARHGPTVLGVCRHLLVDPHDAEDAFQATFLILVRKARTLRDPDRLGPWLYGVAHRVAVRARAQAARRRSRERPGAEQAADRAAERPVWGDLHEEIARLPETYRAVVVLCDLEGLSHAEAARALRWPIGTVKGRLSRARDLLRGRLTRRGLALPAGALAVGVASEATAAVSEALTLTTTRAAVAFYAGRAATAGAVSAAAAGLCQGVLTTMFVSKLKVAAGIVAAVAVVATGAGVSAQFGGGGAKQGDRPPGKSEPREAVKEAVPRRTEITPRDSASPAQLAEVWLGAARNAFRQAEESYENGSVGLDSAASWSRRLLEVEREQATTAEGRIKAHEDHLGRMKELAEMTTHPREGLGRSALEGYGAKYYLREAEVWLAEEKAKHPEAGPPERPDAPAPKGATPKDEAGAVQGMMMPGMPGMMGGMMPGMTGGMGRGRAGDGGMAMGGGGGMYGGGAPARRGSVLDAIASGPFNPFVGYSTDRMLDEAGEDPANQAILELLDRPIALHFADETPLREVLGAIREASKGEAGTPIPIFVDPIALAKYHITLESPVTIDLEGVPLRTSLGLLLRHVALTYVVKDGVLIITSPDSDLAPQEEDPDMGGMYGSARDRQ